MLVLSEHSCGVGVIGMQVQPPLDRSALMSLGHAAVLEQQASRSRICAFVPPSISFVDDGTLKLSS